MKKIIHKTTKEYKGNGKRYQDLLCNDDSTWKVLCKNKGSMSCKASEHWEIVNCKNCLRIGGKTMKKVKAQKKFKCEKCKGTRLDTDYDDGGHGIEYCTVPRCRHKWKLIGKLDASDIARIDKERKEAK